MRSFSAGRRKLELALTSPVPAISVTKYKETIRDTKMQFSAISCSPSVDYSRIQLSNDSIRLLRDYSKRVSRFDQKFERSLKSEETHRESDADSSF
jgi:hypothetical protein